MCAVNNNKFTLIRYRLRSRFTFSSGNSLFWLILLLSMTVGFSRFSIAQEVERLSLTSADAERLDQGERVRVIVTLDIPSLSEASIIGPDEQQEIKQALNAILKTHLPGGIDSMDARNILLFEFLGAFSASLSKIEVQSLMADPLVLNIGSSESHHMKMETPLPEAEQQQQSTATGVLEEIRTAYGIDDLENYGLNGQGQIAAVIDTGVDYSHEFFKGPLVNGKQTYRVIKGACFNTDLAPGYVSTCRNQLPLDEDETKKPGKPCSVHPSCVHGTHVAGIIAGKLPVDSTATLAPKKGIAPKAKIVPINIFSYNPTTHAMNWTDQDLAAALNYVEKLRASGIAVNVINMSIQGGPQELFSKQCAPNPGLAAMFKALRSKNIAAVAASGNHGNSNKISIPACYAGVFDVANVQLNGKIYSTSNFGHYVFPGTNIYSSLPGNHYGYDTGTSQASPMLAGVFLLAKQAEKSGKLDVAKLEDAQLLSQFYIYKDDPAGCDPLLGDCKFWTNPRSFHPGTTILASYTGSNSINYLYVPVINTKYRTTCRYEIPPTGEPIWECNYAGTALYSIGANTPYKIESITPESVVAVDLEDDGTLNSYIAKNKFAKKAEIWFLGMKKGQFAVGQKVGGTIAFRNTANTKQIAPVTVKLSAKRLSDLKL